MDALRVAEEARAALNEALPLLLESTCLLHLMSKARNLNLLGFSAFSCPLFLGARPPQDSLPCMFPSLKKCAVKISRHCFHFQSVGCIFLLNISFQMTRFPFSNIT